MNYNAPTQASKRHLEHDFRERKGLFASRERPIRERKKGIMEKQHNRNEPIKPTAPGQKGGQQGDWNKDDWNKEKDREKQGTGAHQGGGSQQGSGQQTGGR
jgi:hypothetical protein